MGMIDESSMNGDHNEVVEPSPLMEYQSDEELTRRSPRGWQEALGPLHARYAALIYSVAARYLDRSVRRDQPGSLPCCVAACRELRPVTGYVRAWVLQITRRSVLNELRRRDRRPRPSRQSDSSGGDYLPDPPDPAESVSAAEHRRVSCAMPYRLCPLLSAKRQSRLSRRLDGTDERVWT